MNIKKILASVSGAVAGLMLMSTKAFADGGTNPYQPHVPVDTAFSGSEYLFLGAIVLIVLGTMIVSYGRYVKNKLI